MSFEVQTTEFSVKGVIIWYAEADPIMYDYEVGAAVPVGAVIVMVSGEFVQL